MRCSFWFLLVSTMVWAEVAPPSLNILPDGRVVLTCSDPALVIRYTLDGKEPDRTTGAYLAPVVLPAGKKLRARTFSADSLEQSTITVETSHDADPSTVVAVTQDRDWKNYEWAQRHRSVLNLMRTRPPSLVFIGDSITHFWGGEPADRTLRAATVWNQYYGQRQALNLGFGWDRTENVLWRLRHGEVDGIAPKVVVLMIGTNITGLNSSAEIAMGIRAICEELQQRLPRTKILLLGIFPRGAKPNAGREKIDEINQLISAMDGQQNVTYLDIGKVFLEADGSIAPEIMNDYLHPTATGYERWAQAMEPTLKRLLGE